MGGVRVGSVVIDCNDFDRMFAFWRDALGYVPRDEPEDDWVVLRDPSGSNVNVSLQVVPEPRVGKNRLHLDLYAKDRDAEIERLGATIHARTPEPDEDFVVLADPEGNLFCVIQRHPEGRLRQRSRTDASGGLALMRLFRGLCSSSARPSSPSDRTAEVVAGVNATTSNGATSRRRPRTRSRCRRPAGRASPSPGRSPLGASRPGRSCSR
jgi:catechol 2,3-dioxygenase-like lactoylglutathione lyase family enzyme